MVSITGHRHSGMTPDNPFLGKTFLPRGTLLDTDKDSSSQFTFERASASGGRKIMLEMMLFKIEKKLLIGKKIKNKNSTFSKQQL